MNLVSTLELYSGGPGSGCTGPNCGRPAGHGGQHGEAKTWIQKQADAKLKKKQFLQERRRLGLRVVSKDFPTGLTPAALQKLQDESEGGKITVKQKQMLKQTGQLIDLKKQGVKLETNISKVKETYLEKIKIGKKTYNVEVEVFKPVGVQKEGPMGKSRGRNVIEREPQGPHKLWGMFNEALRIEVKSENRRSYVFDAHSAHLAGAGTTVIVHKETVGNTSKVVIQEVLRSEHAHIEATKQYTFKSGKIAKDYLHDRFGIKGIKWKG